MFVTSFTSTLLSLASPIAAASPLSSFFTEIKMSNNKLVKDLDDLKFIFDKTISDPFKAYQAKEDMGTEYEEDANDFESGKEDIEEEDKDLDDKSASKGEASAKRKKPSKDDSEADIEEEDEDLDDESASKGEASAKRKKPSNDDSEEDIEEEDERRGVLSKILEVAENGYSQSQRQIMVNELVNEMKSEKYALRMINNALTIELQKETEEWESKEIAMGKEFSALDSVWEKLKKMMKKSTVKADEASQSMLEIDHAIEHHFSREK